jgi:translocation and assembly module TamB
VRIDDLEVAVDARDLRLGEEILRDSTGDLTAKLQTGTVQGRAEGDTFEVEGVQVDMTLPLRGEPTLVPGVQAAVGRTRASLASGMRVRLEPWQLRASLPGLSHTLELPLPFDLAIDLPRVELSTPPRDRTVVEGVRVTVKGDLPSEDRLNADMDVRVKRLEVRADDLQVATGDLRLDLEARYDEKGPSSVSGTLGLGAVRMARAGEASRPVLAPGELTFDVRDLALNDADPLLSRAKVSASGRFAPFTLALEGQLGGGNGEGSLDVRVGSLEPLLAVMGPEALEGLDFHETRLELRAKGKWTGLASREPQLEHRVEVDVSQAGAHGAGLDVKLPRIGLVLTHEGRGLVHEANLRVEADRAVVNGHALAEPLVLDTKLQADASEQTARLESRLTGPGGLRTDIDASVVRGTVTHSEKLTVSDPAVLASMLPTATRDELAVDFGSLRVELEGRGTATGVLRTDLAGLVDGWEQRGQLTQKLHMTLRGVRYAPEGLTVLVPETHVEVDAQGSLEAIAKDTRVHIPRIDVDDHGSHLTVHEVRQTLRVETNGESTAVHLDGTIARVEQDMVLAYRIEDVHLSALLRLEGEESVELERLVIHNRRGGTRLELQKTLTRGTKAGKRGPQGLALKGKLTQDLARIDGDPKTLKARGTLTAPFAVDSSDGSLFRIHAMLKLDNVDADLPELEVKVRGLHASMPVEEAVEYTAEKGLDVVPFTERNVFSRVRFQDLQPFLSDDSMFEVRKMRWKDVDLGPIVGSMRVDRNVFAIDKIKIQKDDALIAGNLVVDYLPGSERVKFRGKVTGLRPGGSGEPLDANAAIEFDPRRLEVEGRIQIVRVGRKHLLELIDLVDPFREDASMNSLRSALKFGYPKQVSIGLSQGLMSMKVSLGGFFGSLIRLGEIQGVALGPFMTRHVAPYMPW